MLVLDESIPVRQRQLLRSWRIRFRVIGIDTASFGTSDENLIPVLHHLNMPTFVSRDAGFFKRALCHSRYNLVFFDVGESETAEYVRRYLQHPNLETARKRMGSVARVHSTGIDLWRIGKPALEKYRWIGPRS